MDSSGAIHVVWSQATSTGSYNVYYARRAANGSWSAPHNVSNVSGYSSEPQLAVGSDGTVHVIWSGDTGSNTGLFYAQRTPSGGWSTPQFVTTGESPQLAVDNRGIVHLLWRDYGIQYAQRTLDGLWTVPQTLVANGYQPQLAVAADGNAYAFWIQDLDPTSYAPFYAHRSGTTWSHPQQVAGLSLFSPVLSQPRLDGSGTPHLLIYGLESYANAPVYYAKLGTGGSWEKTKIATYHNSPVVEADLVVEINGAVHAAWIGGDSEPSLFYDHKASTGSWSEPQRLVSGIDPREGYEGPFLQVAVDSTGLPHLAWSDKWPDEIFHHTTPGRWELVASPQCLQHPACFVGPPTPSRCLRDRARPVVGRWRGRRCGRSITPTPRHRLPAVRTSARQCHFLLHHPLLPSPSCINSRVLSRPTASGSSCGLRMVRLQRFCLRRIASPMTGLTVGST